MKKIIGAMFALAVGVAISGSASATPAGLTEITGVGNGVADPTAFTGLGGFFEGLHIAAVDGAVDLQVAFPTMYLGRYTANGSTVDPFGLHPVLLNGASISGTGNTASGGTWSFVSGDYVFQVVAIEINAGGGFLTGSTTHLYMVDPAAGSGQWDLSDFSGSDLRNFDYVDLYGLYVGPAAVPEPMSLMLVGGGLAGLGFLRKKKRA